MNEAPPTEEEFKNTLEQKLTRAKTKRPHMMAKLHLYIRLGTRWLMLGLGVCQDVLINRVFMSLPTLYVYGNSELPVSGELVYYNVRRMESRLFWALYAQKRVSTLFMHKYKNSSCA